MLGILGDWYSYDPGPGVELILKTIEMNTKVGWMDFIMGIKG